MTWVAVDASPGLEAAVAIPRLHGVQECGIGAGQASCTEAVSSHTQFVHAAPVV